MVKPLFSCEKAKKKNKQLLILVHAEKIDVLNSSKTKLCN
jgi:hypothetical protein